MNTQIDKKLEELLSAPVIDDAGMRLYLGELPEDPAILLSVLKNIRGHLRTYGRKSPTLEDYIDVVKQRLR